MSDAAYPVLAEGVTAELLDRGSRFIAALALAETVEQARAFIAEQRSAHPGANHHCWAYVVGPPGSQRDVGHSDDGEPHGTAGRPMLNVLAHAEVGDVVAVVTRYFGGTKLGRGGLVRAYGGAVQRALDASQSTPKVRWHPLELAVDYPLEAAVERCLAEHAGEVLGKGYGAQVALTIRLPAPRLPAFAAALRDLSRGTITLPP